MKEKRLFTCEFCHTDYADKAECKKCEDNHKKVKIAEMRYMSYKQDHSGFPTKIVLVDDTGKKYWYKKECSCNQ